MTELVGAAIGFWGLGILTPLVIVLSALAALIERSGTIRLRHWTQEAGGRLSRLHQDARGFEAYRFLLSWGAKLATGVLALALAAVVVPRSPSLLGATSLVVGVLALVLALGGSTGPWSCTTRKARCAA